MLIGGVQFSDQEWQILTVLATPAPKLTVRKIARQLDLPEYVVYNDLDRMYNWLGLKGWGEAIIRLAVWAAQQPEITASQLYKG